MDLHREPVVAVQPFDQPREGSVGVGAVPQDVHGVVPGEFHQIALMSNQLAEVPGVGTCLPGFAVCLGIG